MTRLDEWDEKWDEAERQPKFPTLCSAVLFVNTLLSAAFACLPMDAYRQ